MPNRLNHKAKGGAIRLEGLFCLQGLISRLLTPRQDSFSTVNGTHPRMPEKQKAPETLGFRGFVRMGSGRYRTRTYDP
jgi:hypothetical protein